MKFDIELLSFKGNKDLLDRPKISIVGSRRPNQYTKQMTLTLAKKFADIGYVIVSGGAIGVDTLAHNGAGPDNTITVMPCGLDHIYPAINKTLITNIQKNGLCLSQFDNNLEARNYTFVQRNELVVSLGEVLIVTQADENSGSLRSVEFALKESKKIYVLPHRIGESEGTNRLLEQNLATPIYNIDEFVSSFGSHSVSTSAIIEYFKTNPTYEESYAKYPEQLIEYEISGAIDIINGKVHIK